MNPVRAVREPLLLLHRHLDEPLLIGEEALSGRAHFCKSRTITERAVYRDPHDEDKNTTIEGVCQYLQQDFPGQTHLD